MTPFNYTHEERVKYGRLFAKLETIQLSFENIRKIHHFYNQDPSLNNLPISLLKQFCLGIGEQIRKKDRLLSLPELTLLVKFALRKWANIPDYARPEGKKIRIKIKQRIRFRLSKKPKIYPAVIGREYKYENPTN